MMHSVEMQLFTSQQDVQTGKHNFQDPFCRDSHFVEEAFLIGGFLSSSIHTLSILRMFLDKITCFYTNRGLQRPACLKTP